MKQKTTRERQTLWQSRTDLMNAYQSYKLDDRKALAAIDRINRAQLNLLNIHLDNQIRVRKILNSQQFGDFRTVMEKSFGAGGRDTDASLDIPFSKLPDQRMLDKLGLSTQQRARARALTGPSPELAKAVTRLQSDSRRMAGLYNNYSLDTAAAKKLIAGIHNSQRDVSRAIYQKQKLIRSVLTASQFEKYRAEMNQRMSHKPAHGPSKRPGR
jgi:Spy/CpxP family protein refolding chaperone